MTDYSKIDQPEFLQLIFHPTIQEKSPLPGNSFDLDISVGEGATLGCRFYTCDKEAPVILYFHGNGETVNDHNEIAYMYNKYGINLFVTTYRGYGWSSGNPTVASMMDDAQASLDYLIGYMADNQYTGSIFVMGRSLGSASAIEVASNKENPVKGLIIESGFADLAPLAEKLGVDIVSLGFTEDDGFNSKAKIETIELPTFILHGQKDELISVNEGGKLQAACAARNKQFQIIPGAGHNTMISTAGDLYFQTIKTFIDTITGTNSWRRRRKAFKKGEQ
jgi:alpha-beta hydrolase superfamily lysophospholipase